MVESGAAPQLQCAGAALPSLIPLSTGSRARGLQWLKHVSSVVAAPGLWSTGSVVAAHGLSCSSVRGIFLDRQTVSAASAGRFFITEPPGSPGFLFLVLIFICLFGCTGS